MSLIYVLGITTVKAIGPEEELFRAVLINPFSKADAILVTAMHAHGYKEWNMDDIRKNPSRYLTAEQLKVYNAAMVSAKAEAKRLAAQDQKSYDFWTHYDVENLRKTLMSIDPLGYTPKINKILAELIKAVEYECEAVKAVR